MHDFVFVFESEIRPVTTVICIIFLVGSFLITVSGYSLMHVLKSKLKLIYNGKDSVTGLEMSLCTRPF